MRVSVGPQARRARGKCTVPNLSGGKPVHMGKPDSFARLARLGLGECM